MATHSSVLAWRTPGTGEPGGLPSMGSHRVDTTEVTQQLQQVALIPNTMWALSKMLETQCKCITVLVCSP